MLLGYSAGGQLALNLWSEKPGAWGGVIVDAAYPVQVKEREISGMGVAGGHGGVEEDPRCWWWWGTRMGGLKRWEWWRTSGLGRGAVDGETVAGRGMSG